ncbi:Stp1/IreP family PP2C-type Ser/Thr phosphatase [Fictibacillus iocasae]|uniref:Stp1/IreP family PP2C-type Ser/Thr phosphatase n=1 Tax=Fictibacillus iocasae TaxID=2715437 RepID=A0ABW2NNC2_9BACL
MKTAFQSDTGLVRHHNEDSGGVFTKSGHFLAIIADGMGGHNAGEVASQQAIQYFEEKWKDISEEVLTNVENRKAWLRNTITEVNKHVYTIANENESMKGMGTTIVAAIGDDVVVVIGNIGDSRCYLLNGDEFSKVTEDDTLVNELVKSGQITEDEAQIHPRKNVILKAVGTDYRVEPKLSLVEWKDGDILLLCSDGLSDKVTKDTIEHILRNEDVPLGERALEFIKEANRNGGDDNITVALVMNADVSQVQEGEA